MKKVVLGITSILLIVTLALAVLEVKDYYDTKKEKDSDKLIKEINEEISQKEKEIQEKKNEEEQLKEDNKEKIEELELWQKKVKDMEANLS